MRARRPRSSGRGRTVATAIGALMLGATTPALAETTGFFRGTVDSEVGGRPGEGPSDTQSHVLPGGRGAVTDRDSRPPEPDRSYLAKPQRRPSEQPLSPTDAASIEQLFDKFRTESVTPGGGKSEVIELPPEVKQRLREFFMNMPKNAPRPTERGVMQPPENDAGSLGQNVAPDTSRFAIFGADTRQRIGNTTAFPFRTVGYLEGGCSGALIGPRHVLTAGHCIYDVDTDRWKSVNRFWPAQNGESSPYGVVGVSRLVSITGWTRDHLREYDIGILVLAENSGSRVGWMGFGWQDPMPRYNINLLGYPGDKPSWTMWHSYCPLELATELQLHYKCAQWPGHSGGPVFVYLQAQNSNTIYGVAAYGYLEHFPANADVSLANLATRIDRLRFETIKGWLQNY